MMKKQLKLIKKSEKQGAYTEREIQEAFEAGYDALESGLRRVASFVNTEFGTIDSLAIDETNRPVILEFKKHGASSHDALIQAVDYAVYCRDRFLWLEQTIKTHLPEVKEIDRDLRIVVVASSYEERVKRAARGVEFDTLLVSFEIFEQGEEAWILSDIEVDTSVGGIRDVPIAKTKPQHLAGLSAGIVSLYEKFEKAALAFAADIKPNYQPQGYIGLRNSKKTFVGVYPKQQWIRLDFPITADEAESEGYEISEGSKWGYFHLTEETFDEGMRLFSVAYNKTLEE